MQTTFSKKIHGRFQDYASRIGDIDGRFFSVFDFEEMESGPPDLIWNFAPSTNAYYSPLHPLFLHATDSIDDLRGLPFVMARDGLLPLLWFLERATFPQFPCKILVPSEFTNLIPDKWRPYLGTYQVTSKRRSMSITPSRRVLIHGLAVKNFLSVDLLKKRLKVLRGEIERQNLEVQEFLVLMSLRDDPFYRTECDKFNCLILGELIHELQCKGKIRFLSQKEFFSFTSFNECKIFEINRKILIADSFIHHYALARGAELLLDPWAPGQESWESGNGLNYHELSPFHGMVVGGSIGACKLAEGQRKTLADLKQLYISEAENGEGRAQIWPLAFFEYVKKMATRL